MLRKQPAGFDNSGEAESTWLITLSDVLTLLLIFFIMFAFMTKNMKSRPVQADKTEEPVRNQTVADKDVPDNIAEMKAQMDNALRDLNMEDDVEAQTRGNEMIIFLKEKVSFKSGDAALLAASEPVLDKIASIIKANPSLEVEINGHTDNIPINSSVYPSNWELSVARAASVLKYFMNRHSLDPSRLSIKGNADQKPLVENDSPEHRTQNRRVEIRMKENKTL